MSPFFRRARIACGTLGAAGLQVRGLGELGTFRGVFKHVELVSPGITSIARSLIATIAEISLFE